MTKLLAPTLALILSNQLQAQSAKFPDIEVQAITQVNSTYGEAFNKNDSSLFLDCYAADGCILASGAPALCGQKGLLLFFKAAYRTGMRNIVFTTLNWYGYNGAYVTEQGTYRQVDAEGHSIGVGKYLVVWQKLAKGWRMLRDMFNADATPRL